MADERCEDVRDGISELALGSPPATTARGCWSTRPGARSAGGSSTSSPPWATSCCGSPPGVSRRSASRSGCSTGSASRGPAPAGEYRVTAVTRAGARIGLGSQPLEAGDRTVSTTVDLDLRELAVLLLRSPRGAVYAARFPLPGQPHRRARRTSTARM